MTGASGNGVKTVFDPEVVQRRRKEGARRAAASAEAENEKAFENMKSATDKKGVEHTEAFKYFRDIVFFKKKRGVLCGFLLSSRTGTP